MSKLLTSASFAALLFASAVRADVPNVVTDIAPVQGLAAIVLDGLGEPELVIPAGASPHGYALKPSNARDLQNADLVIGVGSALTPWFEDVAESLAPNAQVIELLTVSGTHLLEGTEDHHDHDHGHADHEEDDHDDHADHDEDGHDDHHDDHAEHEEEHDDHHDDHAEHEEEHDDHHDDHAEHEEEHDDHHDDHAEHEEEHDDHADHDDGGMIDPHAWIDPENGKVWLAYIAAELSKLDPENAETYAANAAKGVAAIDASVAEATVLLAPTKSVPFIVFHDAYRYYEGHFGLNSVGAVRLGDASNPTPAHIRELQEQVEEAGVVCAFREPQYSAKILEVVVSNTELKVGEVDLLGTALAQDVDFYPNLIVDLAESFAICQ